jgi:hypothetical protein
MIMKSEGVGILKKVSYKPGGVVSVMVAIYAGKDGSNSRLLSAILNANQSKCEGLQAVEFELKNAQSTDVDATLLVDLEVLNLYAYKGKGEYINYSGLLTSISIREKKNKPLN